MNCLVCKINLNKNKKYCNLQCQEIYKYLNKIDKIKKLNNIYIFNCLICKKRIVSLLNKKHCKKHKIKKIKKEKIKYIKNCFNCKNEFTTFLNSKKYCNVKCKKHFNNNKNKILLIKNCFNCNKEFKTYSKRKLICKKDCKIYVIYRFFIDNFSYIGITKNWRTRYLKHKKFIEKYYQNISINKIDLEPNLFYRKLGFYCLENKKKLDNINFEILKRYIEIDIFNLEKKEIKYIEKYNTILNGFNGINYFYYKIITLLETKEKNIEYIKYFFKIYSYYIDKIIKIKHHILPHLNSKGILLEYWNKYKELKLILENKK